MNPIKKEVHRANGSYTASNAPDTSNLSMAQDQNDGKRNYMNVETNRDGEGQRGQADAAETNARMQYCNILTKVYYFTVYPFVQCIGWRVGQEKDSISFKQ